LLILTAFGLVYSKYFAFAYLTQRFYSQNTYIGYIGLGVNILSIGFAIIARNWLGKNWSGTVTIKRDHELLQSGPYSITRHPIYTGIFFGLAGAVLVQGEIRGLMALLLLFIAMQMKMTMEEKFLREVFPEYRQYAIKTKKLIPLIY
jgi:protein-S-isoprenylcysteine O-methyltransferase Ste14